jgi:hypothetical protein
MSSLDNSGKVLGSFIWKDDQDQEHSQLLLNMIPIMGIIHSLGMIVLEASETFL